LSDPISIEPPIISAFAVWITPLSRLKYDRPSAEERIPARMMFAVSVPAVMKSATIAPFIVIAVLNGPE